MSEKQNDTVLPAYFEKFDVRPPTCTEPCERCGTNLWDCHDSWEVEDEEGMCWAYDLRCDRCGKKEIIHQ